MSGASIGLTHVLDVVGGRESVEDDELEPGVRGALDNEEATLHRPALPLRHVQLKLIQAHVVCSH